MGIKTPGRDTQGNAPKMRKPPLKARAYTTDDVTPARRGSANLHQKPEEPAGSASLPYKTAAGDSLSSSSTPYDPVMSTYCSTSDTQKQASLSAHDASALGDTSMHSCFSREHTIKASSMSELYPVSEHLDPQERSSSNRCTPLAITSTADQQAIITHKIHSNYTSAGTTFALRVVNPRTGLDMNGGLVNPTQDSSFMSATGPEPAETLSFTGMEPRASYSRAQRIPLCIDENDNVALSDSVHEMMAAMTEVAYQDKSLNPIHEHSGKDHTLSTIKNSVVYNSQAYNPKSSDSVNTPGDNTATHKASQISNDVSLNLASGNLHLSFRNQTDNSQQSGSGNEIPQGRDGFLVPSTIPETSTCLVTDQWASEPTTSSHKKEPIALSMQNESSAESKIPAAKSDEKELITPKFSLSSIKCLPLASMGLVGGDRCLSSVRSIRPSFTNTYDYHDYTTTDDFRSDPILSDITATRSTLVQFGNYTNTTSQNNSDCGIHSDFRDLAHMHKGDPVAVVEDGVELGLSEIGVQIESVQFIEKQYNSPSSVSTAIEHPNQRASNSAADNLINNDTPSADMQTNKPDKRTSVTAQADTSGSVYSTLQSAAPHSGSQKTLPKQSSVHKLNSPERLSPELVQQFQLFQQFQQFQQLQRMQCFQSSPEAYQYVPQTATLNMQPAFIGVQGPGTRVAVPKTTAFDTPCTPISNPKTGPGRPSSARSPYPGIESRIGGASPFDKTIKGVPQNILNQNPNITESAIDIVNDVVNALGGHKTHEDAPSAQLALTVANMATSPADKEDAGLGAYSDVEPSESFMTERLRNLSKLPGYKATGREEFILQQTIPRDVTDTSVYRYMTNTQKSRFAELREGDFTKITHPGGNDIEVETYEDSCMFIEDIRQSLRDLQKLSHGEVMRLLKQVMLGAVQQHKLITNYKNTVVKLQEELAENSQRRSAGAHEPQSPTGSPDLDTQVRTLKANLRKALARNTTLVAKLEEYAERIKEYKRHEMHLAKLEKEREREKDLTQCNSPEEQQAYIKASPRRS